MGMNKEAGGAEPQSLLLKPNVGKLRTDKQKEGLLHPAKPWKFLAHDVKGGGTNLGGLKRGLGSFAEDKANDGFCSCAGPRR